MSGANACVHTQYLLPLSVTDPMQLNGVHALPCPLQLIRPGGVIAFDNVLWRGQVADSTAQDKQTAAMRDLNDFLLRDSRVDFCLLPIGDGMAMCRKRE